MRNLFYTSVLIYIITSLLSSCVQETHSKNYKIGFSQCVESDNWRKTMLQGMKRELNFYPNVTFIYKQADGDSHKQIGQVKQLLAENIDLLIISPNEAEPLTAVVEEAYNKGIPVIVIDRKIASTLYTAYIGADNFEVGLLAGEYASSLLKSKGSILEITGLPGSSPSIERDSGFQQGLNKSPNSYHLIRTHGDWTKQATINRLRQLPGIPDDIDLVFAQNDVMAIGAYEFFKARQPQNHIKFIGVDAQAGTTGGMQFVSDKILTASLLYPTGGEEAIQLAVKILNGENFNKQNFLNTSVVDSSNVRLLKLQSEKISTQQYDIERQQQKIDNQRRIYNTQRNYLYILSTTLLVAVSLGAIAFFSLRANRKINKKLKARNQEILEQKNKIAGMAQKAQEANEERIQFFTNISHEFRTPLTLILGPLDELLLKEKLNAHVRHSMLLIQKNAIRLLRLLNQLMDFRKLEFDRLKIRVSENDLIDFVREVMDAYKEIARKRNIDLRLFTKDNELNAWFDVTMLDKILFNLLSNAFKFTKDNGHIYVTMQRSPEKNNALITIEDNGVGMTKEEVEHAFDLFYQGENDAHKGSGLGLTLSKELMRLHHGAITIRSEQWKGAQFTLTLPLGYAHFTEEERTGTSRDVSLYEEARIYTAELQAEIPETKTFALGQAREHTILIIEDNPDLRCFLRSRLQDAYEILEAENTNTAIQQAFDNTPDVIICDIMIPGKNGIELTNLFKTDLRTSHIPVILLTAQTSINYQLEGMRNKADAYITKPFNLQVLEGNIKSLLENRSLLKQHFTGDVSHHLKSPAVNKLDKKFINDFNALVELNISNENFNVEDICRQLGVSRVQLYRKIKALLNCNINEYVLDKRMQKAKYLLRNETDLSIAEVAYKVGFSSAAYFSTVMKSKLGVTPTEYRNNGASPAPHGC